MDNATKNKLMSGTDQSDLTSGNACWETPPLVFAKLAEDYGPFDVDLTADSQRALCPVWLGPGSQHGLHSEDALQAPWMSYGRIGYSNPPYGAFVQKMLAKAKQEAAEGFTSVLLLPMRATKAFHAHILNGAAELRFCDKRIVFFENGVPRLNEKAWREGRLVPDTAVFDSIVVVYRRGAQSLLTGAWAVPPHVTREDLERAAERKT